VTIAWIAISVDEISVPPGGLTSANWIERFDQIQLSFSLIR
jgi:hypothetical protein